MIYLQTYHDDYIYMVILLILIIQNYIHHPVSSVLDPLLIALLPFTASMWLLVLFSMIGESLAVALIERAHSIINVSKQSRIGHSRLVPSRLGVVRRSAQEGILVVTVLLRKISALLRISDCLLYGNNTLCVVPGH